MNFGGHPGMPGSGGGAPNGMSEQELQMIKYVCLLILSRAAAC